MATRDLYINIRPDRNIGAFIKSHKDGSAYTLPSIFREEQVNLRLFFCEPNATGGLSSPLSLLNDLSSYSCRVGIGTPGNDTPLAVVTLAWNVDGYFEGALNVNTTEMNTALDGASGSISKTFEVELNRSGEEFTFQQAVTVRDEVLLHGAGLPSDVNDTLFADLLAGTLVDSPEVDYVRDGDDVESHIAVWRDATLSGQLRLECPASSAHSTDALNDTGSTSVTVNGFNDRLYQLDLRVRGLCVLMNYTGGSQLGYVYLGGTYNHDTSDPWWIEISDPPQTVRLNATAGLPLNRLALDYLLSVTAKGGATITLHYDTQDGAISPYVSPIYVPGVAPYPDEFDGHFLELTLVNSNKEGITLADLDDGPTAAQRDSGGKFVKVKSDGSGLEYVAGSVASHASSHASGGSDPVTLAQSQITDLTTDLAAKASLASPTFTGTPAAPTAAGGTNTTQIATTAFVQSAVGSVVSGLLELKGNLDCSADPNYPSASAGDTYYCSVAGKVGGASGKSVDVGDAIVAQSDNVGGTEGSVGTSWFVLEHNLTGVLLSANNLSDVASASTSRSNLGLGDSATKNVGTSSGTVCAGNDSRLTDSRTPTAHASTHASGGSDSIKLDDLATPDDNTDLDATTGRHGLLPKLGGGTSNFLRADGSWASVLSGLSLYAENPIAPSPNTVSGANSFAIGMNNSLSIGAYESAAIGCNVVLSERWTVGTGGGAVCDKYAQRAHKNGFAQISDLIASIQTSNGTQTELFADDTNASKRLVLANNSTWAFKILVCARRTDASENDGWEFTGLIHRDANAASTSLDEIQQNQIGSTSWSVSVDADTTNGSLRIRVTGQAAKTVKWGATVQTIETNG